MGGPRPTQTKLLKYHFNNINNNNVCKILRTIFHIEFEIDSRALSIHTVETKSDHRFAKYETKFSRKVFVRQGQQFGRKLGNRLFAFGQLERSNPVM